MEINAYLGFDGNCEEAFKFYEKLLDAEITFMMTHEQAPVETPAEWRGKIMHARLKIGDAMIMGGDNPPGYYHKPAGFSVSIGLKELEKAAAIFAALAQGGNINMPFQKTFWAEGFGMVTDRFGTPWMIYCGS